MSSSCNPKVEMAICSFGRRLWIPPVCCWWSCSRPCHFSFRSAGLRFLWALSFRYVAVFSGLQVCSSCRLCSFVMWLSGLWVGRFYCSCSVLFPTWAPSGMMSVCSCWPLQVASASGSHAWSHPGLHSLCCAGCLSVLGAPGRCLAFVCLTLLSPVFLAAPGPGRLSLQLQLSVALESFFSCPGR